jgi:hypothetical protein
MPLDILTIERLVLIIGLCLIGSPAIQAEQTSWEQPHEAVSHRYSTYQVSDDATTPPGIGMRYSIQQQWFLFGETHHANQVPTSQEPRLFHPDEPRTILIGGGIYF